MTSTRRLALACTVACLSMAALVQAHPPATETCPPPPSAPATSPTLNTSPALNPLRPPLAQILACVGSQSLTGAVFRHWVGVAKRAEGRHAKTHALIEQAMGFLISSDWLIGEAQDLHVYVSAEEVRHTFHRIRHEQFRKRGEFSAFLRRSGQTVGDILFRVKVNLMSTRILRQVVAGQHGTGAREDALARFVSEFDMKWRAQTYCSPAYAVRDCGHAQAVL